MELLDVAPPLKAPALLAVLGFVRLAQNRAAEALGPAKEAMRLLESIGGLEEGESCSFASSTPTRSMRLRVTSKALTSRSAWARGRLLERATRISDPNTRETFLRRVPENARTLALAEQRDARAIWSRVSMGPRAALQTPGPAGAARESHCRYP